MSQRNTAGTAIALAARTDTVTSAVIENPMGKYLTIFVNCTLDPSTASITPSVVWENPLDASDTETIWTAAAAFAATGNFLYQLGPGLLASAGGGYDDTENVVIPTRFKIVCTAADNESMTYGVGYNLIG